MHLFQGQPYYFIAIAQIRRGEEPYWTYDRNEVGVDVTTREHRSMTSHASYGSFQPLSIWEYLLQEITEFHMFQHGGFMLNGVPVRTEADARVVVAEMLELDKVQEG